VAEHRRNGWEPVEAVTASPRLAGALDAIAWGGFSPGDPDLFSPLIRALSDTDDYMVTADFESYFDTQRRVDALRRQKAAWAKSCIMNIAAMGWFSSDRAIRGYAEAVWQAPL
jgi:glycogen phosphorylase